MNHETTMKLLLGGSPCTYWSIAQKKNRETEASGTGWELFRNYIIARDKFHPDYFLYENNKSMSSAIREQITQMLGVEPVLINSSLVSAQNRQRLYWVGRRNEDGSYSTVQVEQPRDRGILLRDILDSGTTDKEKAYLKHQAGNARDYFKKHYTQITFELTNTAGKPGLYACPTEEYKTVAQAIPDIVEKCGLLKFTDKGAVKKICKPALKAISTEKDLNYGFEN